MKIIPQDIIDREFRVKFRGFDMAEVDTFLEEVAENFFKLTEENTLLNEKILALQNDLQVSGTAPSMGQAESAELGSILEDIRQDIETMRTELAALKQDRQNVDSLEKNLQAAIVSIQKAAGEMQPQSQLESADISKTLEEFKQGTEAIAAELAALKEERNTFESLKTNLQEVIASAQEAAASISPQGQVELPANLGKTLEEFKQGAEAIAAELASFKEEAGSIQKIREEIKGELQDMLTSHFNKLEARLFEVRPETEQAAPKPKAAAKPKKKEPLLAAQIEEEPEGLEEDTRLPDYEDLEADDSGTEAMEFLTEDDILDVDKLRDVFQSVLDDSISNGHNTREGEDDDSSADLLFLEDDDFFEDDHEPEVTFSLEDKKIDKNPKLGKT